MADVQSIKIEQIQVSKTNPRKHFDQQAISELAKSIKEKGLIQPITVRPIKKAQRTDPKNTKIKYEIVAGERRYRATREAKLDTIDCIIRDLSDEEAFDIQVIENVQREDVHPIDEAIGFKMMLDSDRFDVKEISLKIGKPESFIHRRLKLNDLIDELKQAMFDDQFGIGHALEICRLPEVDQMDLYQNIYSPESSRNSDMTVNELISLIDRKFINKLSAAPFKPSDDKLVPEVGACTKCPFRSGANPTLFGDVEDDDICFNRPCYMNKCDAAFRINLKKAKEKDLVFIHGYRNYDEDLVKQLKSEGYEVLENYDDFNEAADKKLSEPGIKKAFWISGNDIGQFTRIQLRAKSSGSDKKTMDELSPAEKIKRINEREARKAELDREKVQNATIEYLSEYPEPENVLSREGIIRFCAYTLLHNVDYGYKNDLMIAATKKYGLDIEEISWHEEQMALAKYLLEIGEAEILTILRHNYQHEMTSSTDRDYEKSGDGYMYRQFAEALFPEKIKEFDAVQTEKAEKRKSRVQERIGKLEGKIKKVESDA